MSRLQHDNITELEASFKAESYHHERRHHALLETYILVTRLAVFGDLHHFVGHLTYNDKMIPGIVKQLAEGLDYMVIISCRYVSGPLSLKVLANLEQHNQGLAHGDFKPENVLLYGYRGLNAAPHVKISDLGSHMKMSQGKLVSWYVPLLLLIP